MTKRDYGPEYCDYMDLVEYTMEGKRMSLRDALASAAHSPCPPGLEAGTVDRVERETVFDEMERIWGLDQTAHHGRPRQYLRSTHGKQRSEGRRRYGTARVSVR